MRMRPSIPEWSIFSLLYNELWMDAISLRITLRLWYFLQSYWLICINTWIIIPIIIIPINLAFFLSKIITQIRYVLYKSLYFGFWREYSFNQTLASWRHLRRSLSVICLQELFYIILIFATFVVQVFFVLSRQVQWSSMVLKFEQFFMFLVKNNSWHRLQQALWA